MKNNREALHSSLGSVVSSAAILDISVHFLINATMVKTKKLTKQMVQEIRDLIVMTLC